MASVVESALASVEQSKAAFPRPEPTAEQLIELGRAMQRAEVARDYQKTYLSAYASQKPTIDLHWNLGAGVPGYEEVRRQMSDDILSAFTDLVEGACCAYEDRVRRLRRKVLGE